MRDFTREISSLATLFNWLPDSLPLNPPSSHLEFSLDEGFVRDEGWGAAFNRQMEVAWRSWQGPICIRERGLRLDGCIQLLQKANSDITSDSERDMWLGGWLDKLSQAAIDSGATIIESDTKSSTECIVLSDTEDTVKNSMAPVLPAPSIPKAPPQAPLLLNGKLNFQKIPRELALAQSAERAKTLASRHEYREAAKAERAEQEKIQKREEERIRKAAWRERKKEKEIQTGKRDADGKLVNSADKPSNTDVAPDDEIAAATAQALHAGRSQTHNERLMRQKKPLKNVQKRVCWQGPATWVHILAAVKAEGIEYARKHPTAVVKRLKLTHRDTKLFDKLHESVVGRWFTTDDSGRACWKPTVLLRALKESGLGGGGRSKKLAQYPAVLEGAIQQLKALRRTNTPVSCAIARSIILAHLRIHAPQVQMTLSNQWIQRFMRDQLGWSYRTATKAARKRPSNWESQGLLMFLRMVKTIDQYQIRSPRMIVNADQTGISLLPTGNKTWETVGKDQVSSISHDEKRQVYALAKPFYPRLILSEFTLVVASSCGGDFLPFQSVWGGKTEGSLPNKTAPRRAEADQLGFTFAHGDKRHWSSLSTTKSWVEETLIPYLKTVREEEGLPPDAAAMLLVDAWPTHISKANPECFIPWMKKEHPEIKIHFVPAGCTGELQPADTLLQRVIKHIIKIASLDYFVACSTRQLQAGVAPEAVVLPNGLPSLRDASVAWTLEAFRYMQSHPEVVQKAWARCQTGEWNLTWDKLTSSAAKDLFYATLSTNEAFRNELGMSGPIVPRSRQEDEPGLDVPHDEAAEEFESSEDDVAIPVEQLVNVLTGENIPQGIRSAEDGGWTRFGDEDDIDLVSAEPGDELQGESDHEINAESDDEPGAQTDSPEELHAAPCVDNDDQPDPTDTTGNDVVNSINQEQPFMDAPGAKSVEVTATTISNEALPGSTTAYNHGGEAHAESNAVQSTTPDAPAQEQSSEKNTTTEGNDTVAYAVDIAVLGGTHPAMYSDTSRILPTKRGRSGGKPKATDTDAAEGSQNVVHEEPMDQSQVNKRPRRSSRLSKEVDGVPNEPRKGRGPLSVWSVPTPSLNSGHLAHIRVLADLANCTFSLQFWPDTLVRYIMDAEKEGAIKSLKLAQKHLEGGNISEARRLADKSIRLHPTAEAKAFLASLPDSSGASPATATSSGTETHPSAGGAHIRKGKEKADGGEASSSEKKWTTEQAAIVKRVRSCGATEYYEVLAISKEADDGEVKKAYRKLALQLHPDKNNAPGADEAFKLVSKAFTILSDPQKRAVYDQVGGDPEQRGGGGGRSPSGMGGMHMRPGYNHMFFEEEINPEDVFNMFFGGGGFGGGGFGGPGFNAGFGNGFGGGPIFTASFGGPGIRMRRFPQRPPAPETGRQGPELADGRSLFVQLLPLIALLAISLFSSLISVVTDSTPRAPGFRFDKTRTFDVGRTTSRLDVPYFVSQSEWAQHTVGKAEQHIKTAEKEQSKKEAAQLRSFERVVERQYEEHLYNLCQHEADTREHRAQQHQGVFGFGADWDKIRSIRAETLPHCEKLKLLRLKDQTIRN